MILKTNLANLSIDPNILFPFFFKVDANLMITEAGQGLQKIFPGIAGESPVNLFSIKDEEKVSPISTKNLMKVIAKGSSVILEGKTRSFLLRGVFYNSDDKQDIFFLGNPCITSPDKIEELGLTTNDFAAHDTITDTSRLITNLEKNNNELKIIAENSDLLHKIIDLAPQQIFLKDSQSRFLLVNKRMAEIFGVEIADIIGKTDRDFWSNGEEVDIYASIERKVLETGIAFENPEEPSTHRDGRKCVSHVTKMPFTLANGEKCVLGIAIDITDIKEAQQAKFEIASGVLHDIGNAVVGFGSYLTRIKRSLDQNNLTNLENLASFFVSQQPVMANAIGEAKAGAVVDMLNGITHMQKAHQEELRKSISEQLNIIAHIQEILNIQRQYVSGYQPQERKPIHLRSVINDCMAMVFASIDKRNIVVSLDINAELPIIKGDRTKLMQVILNILKNSVEAIDIHSLEKTISIRLYTHSGNLVLQVHDSGIGFDQTTASMLFERGFTTKSNGTGLGLYNCKTIIESHAGTISITSDGIGKGATTIIEFKL